MINQVPEGGLRGYDGVKVFSATMNAERGALGERASGWLQAEPRREVVAVVVTQSSDARHHCVSLTIFWRARDSALRWAAT